MTPLSLQVAEVSSAWDELVVNFQNLNGAKISHYNAQELLSQLDANVTEAIMKAMDDRNKIHTEVGPSPLTTAPVECT